MKTVLKKNVVLVLVSLVIELIGINTLSDHYEHSNLFVKIVLLFLICTVSFVTGFKFFGDLYDYMDSKNE